MPGTAVFKTVCGRPQTSVQVAFIRPRLLPPRMTANDSQALAPDAMRLLDAGWRHLRATDGF